MSTYTITLKGTKKNNTSDIVVVMHADNKVQCFNLAYTFFEKGDTDVVYGRKATGLRTIHAFMPDADQLRKYAGKYKVTHTSITRVNA